MNSDLQEKLARWEVPPPGEAWQRIAASLDGDEEYRLAQKLNGFAALPPADAWNKIEAGLQEKETPVIFLPKWRRPVFRYASVAAAVLLVVALSTNLLRQQTDSGKLVQQPAQQTFSVPVVPAQSPKSYTTTTNSSNTASPHGERKVAVSVKRMNRQIRAASQIAAASSFLPALSLSTNPKNNRLEQVVLLPEENNIASDLVERYMVLPNSSEEAIKLSKKVYGLYNCSDVPSRRECEENLNSLRQKAATPSLLASADFTGVLELIRNVDTNH